MFVQVETLFPYYTKDESVEWRVYNLIILNAEKIITLSKSGDNYLIDIGNDDNCYTISPAEYARLSALLMPAPIEPAVPLPERPIATTNGWRMNLLAILDEYAGCLRGELCDMSTQEGQYSTSKIRSEILDFADKHAQEMYAYGRNHSADKMFADGADWQKTQASALPSDVIEAAQAYDRTLHANPYVAMDTKKTSTVLIDVIFAHMPKEAE